MATAFRATVMLAVLVGLPSAWVYYGPLPPEAMGVIERTIGAAKESMGVSQSTASIRYAEQSPKTAPRFNASVTQASNGLEQQVTSDTHSSPTPPMKRDHNFSLASASFPTRELEKSVQVEGELAKQLEPHLSLLRSLGAAEYTLENWGGAGQLYRFRCSVSLGETADHTRQFEAVDADPQRAVHHVVGEVTSWQNARLSSANTRWR